tara:strand:+ start:3641 stop:3925 length:285 start_codon:yes stop_codon:yes gene_type:complete
MKLTKTKLKTIIKEEYAKIEAVYEATVNKWDVVPAESGYDEELEHSEPEYMPEELIGAIGRAIEIFYPEVDQHAIFPLAQEIETLVKSNLGDPA